MTPYALLATAFLAPLSLVSIIATWSRWRRGETVGRWRTTGAIVSGLFLVVATLAIAGWAMPDAYDQLTQTQREAIGPALDATPECGWLPFARVIEVRVQNSPEEGPTLSYTCGISHLGIPRFSNRAGCADGSWIGPGFGDIWTAGNCMGLPNA